MILDFERAASERARWKVESRSFATLVKRLFFINADKLGMPNASTMPTMITVISSSYSVNPFTRSIFIAPIYKI